MKILVLLSLAALAASAADRPDWKLVWSDEFEKPGQPDPAKWGFETGMIRNNEKQFYTDNHRENARVEDGKLIIEARVVVRLGLGLATSPQVSPSHPCALMARVKELTKSITSRSSGILDPWRFPQSTARLHTPPPAYPPRSLFLGLYD